ncbi:MAG: hypothetical protein OHK0053_18690 [Microscillaceae bacterium]
MAQDQPKLSPSAVEPSFSSSGWSILDQIQEGYFTLNKENVLIHLNAKAETYWGLPRRQLLGRSVWELLETGHKYQLATQLRRTTTHGECISLEEYLPLQKQYYRIRAYRAGMHVHVLLQEITAEKNLLSKLKSAENKLGAILNSTTDANILLDTRLHILEFNQAAQRATKYFHNRTLEVGAYFMDFIVKETQEEVKALLQQALKGEKIKVERQVNFSPDLQVWFEISCLPVYDYKGKIIAVTFNTTNVDTQKKAQLKLIAQNEQLHSIAWQQSHKVRRPLATMLGLLNLIKLEGESKPEYLEYLLSSAEELDHIIHEIVQMTEETEE